MAEQTTHFQLSLREAADIFNPLSTNDNFTTIDAILYELKTKGGIIGYSGTVSANLLTLSGTPTENDTIFKVIPDGDCNTVSFSGAVRQIQAPNGTQMTLKANTLYVCYMSSSAMVALAWPDSVDANTFDGQSASYYATASSVSAVDSKADNATQVAQAATTIANNALTKAESAGMSLDKLIEPGSQSVGNYTYDISSYSNYKLLLLTGSSDNMNSVIIPVGFSGTYFVMRPTSIAFSGGNATYYRLVVTANVNIILTRYSGVIGDGATLSSYCNPPVLYGIK